MGGKSSTTTQKVQIPPEVLARYNAVNKRAEDVAATPFQRYSNDVSDFVAQINDQQRQGIDAVNAAAGSYDPYFQGAAAATVAGLGSVNPGELDIGKYMNPYQQDVIDTTMAQMTQANDLAQSGALGTAISSGAFGGDRAGIAAANLANQQNMAMGSTLAGLNSQNYMQALAAAQQQQGVNLGAEQANLARLLQGGQQLAGLGAAYQQAGLTGAEAMINAGTLEQQTEQAGLEALYNQFQQEKAYPFQVAQFLANIAMGTGALSGSTTTTTQPGSFWSDRRLKHDIKRIGKTDDGLPIYKFKYKGDPEEQTHIGFMADEVEQKKPEAVGVAANGYKYVDYDRAARATGGGVAGPYGSQVGSQPGAGGYVPQAYLPVGELMIADPGVLNNARKGLMQQLESVAKLGDTVKSLDESWQWGKEKWDSLNRDDTRVATGGVVNGYALGGMPELPELEAPKPDAAPQNAATGVSPGYLDATKNANPVKSESYLKDTLDEQSQKLNKLDAPDSMPGQPKSTMSKIGETAKAIAAVASLFASDRRLKHDIKRIGKTDNGLPIYSFKYKGDDRMQTHIGFMADEVEKKHPGAVVTGEDGYKMVDYGQAHKFYRGGIVRPGYATDGSVEMTEEEKRARELAADMRAFAMRDPVVNEVAKSEGLSPASVVSRMPDVATSAGVVPAATDVRPSVAPITPAELSAAGIGGVRPSVVLPVDETVVRGPQANTGIISRDTYDPIVPTGTQRDFLWSELQTNPYKSFLATDWKDPAAAARGFESIYEKSGGSGNDIAEANAREIFAAAQEGRLDSLNPSVAETYNDFVARGMSPIHAAGATGRLMVESYASLDPNARNTTGGGYGTYGLAQWRGPRLEALANFAGVPLETIVNAPVSTPEGRYYSHGLNFVEPGVPGQRATVSASGVAGGNQFYVNKPFFGLGTDKPFADRTTVGKMFYNSDGTVNRNAMLSLMSGVGSMLASPSQWFLPSVGLGLQGFAGTYANLENDQVENLKKQAETSAAAQKMARDNIFSVDGVNVIQTPNGLVNFWDFFDNQGHSTGDRQADMYLRQIADWAIRNGLDPNTLNLSSTISAPAGAGSVAGAEPPPGVMWGDPSTEALARDREMMRSQPGIWSQYVQAAPAQMTDAIQARSAAQAGRQNTNEMALMIGLGIGEGNFGTFGEWYANNVIKPLRTFLPESLTEDWSTPDAQSAILAKLRTLSASDMTPDQQRAAAVFQQFSDIFPSLDTSPEAAAAIMAGIMTNSQDDIDRANYYQYYLSQQPTGRGALMGADTAYADEYARIQQVERSNLTELFDLASDPEVGSLVTSFLEDVHGGRMTPERAQAALTEILGEGRVSPGLYRYFLRG